MKYSFFFLTFDMYIDSELPLLYDLDLKFSTVSEKKNTKANGNFKEFETASLSQ